MTENATAEYEEEDEFILGLFGQLEVGLLCLIFVIGGPLNVLSFVRTLRQFRATRVKSQILLLRINLNIADLFTQFIYVPRQIIWMLTFQWYGGAFLCRTLSFFATFSFYLNSFVIACIAIDRVYGAYNMSSVNAHRTAYTRCRNMIIAGWTGALVLSLPQIFIFQLLQPFPDFKQCVPIWTVVAHESHMIFLNLTIPDDVKFSVDESLRQIKYYEQSYNVLHVLFVFWLPCIIIVISYVMVLFILQGHLKQSPIAFFSDCFCKSDDKEQEYGSASSSATIQPNEEAIVMIRMREESSYGESVSCHQERTPRYGGFSVSTIHKAKQYALRQAALIILAYLSFWSPYQLISMLNMISPNSSRGVSTLSILNAVICANSIVNPIIYGVFKNPLKK